MNTTPKLYIVAPDHSSFERACKAFGLDRSRTFWARDNPPAIAATNRRMNQPYAVMTLQDDFLSGWNSGQLVGATKGSEG